MTILINQKMIGTVTVIIVTFNPLVSNLLTMLKTLGDISHIVIVDNGTANCFDWQKNICSIKNLELIQLESNQGLAIAQNIGIRLALTKKSDFVLFIDQDSEIDNSLIPKLLSSFNLMSHQRNIAAIGPAITDRIKKISYPIICLNKYGFKKTLPLNPYDSPIEASVLISSGSLIAIKALQDVGLMNESFFIDFVDTEWFFRAAAKGYRFYVNPTAVMQHSVGDDSIRFFKWKTPIHSGERRYYRVRNSLKLLALPYIPIYLRLRVVLTTICQQFVLITTQPNKKSYLSSLYRGVKDGLFGH